MDRDGEEIASQRPRTDPLDAQIRQEERVAIYYLLEGEFPPLRYQGAFEGFVDGEEQAILEEELRKKLRRLQLAEGQEVSGKLKAFVTDTGSPRDIIAMLELMPEVRRRHYSSSPLGRGHVEAEVAKLRDRIVALLRELGVNMAFTAEGRLQEADFDKMPRALKELPKHEELTWQLPLLLRDQPVVSVLFIDLDEFKAVNDKYNHNVGDECLVGFVDIASKVLREKGKLYRSFHAGDEFVVLLPNFDADEAAPVAERLRRTVEATPIGREVKVTASIGIASSAKFADATELLKASEGAMYASKVMGRNRVHTAPLSADITAKVAEERAKAKGR